MELIDEMRQCHPGMLLRSLSRTNVREGLFFVSAGFEDGSPFDRLRTGGSKAPAGMTMQESQRFLFEYSIIIGLIILPQRSHLFARVEQLV